MKDGTGVEVAPIAPAVVAEVLRRRARLDGGGLLELSSEPRVDRDLRARLLGVIHRRVEAMLDLLASLAGPR